MGCNMISDIGYVVPFFFFVIVGQVFLCSDSNKCLRSNRHIFWDVYKPFSTYSGYVTFDVL